MNNDPPTFCSAPPCPPSAQHRPAHHLLSTALPTICSAPPSPPSAQHGPTCVQRSPYRRRRRPELIRLGDWHPDHTLVQPGCRHAGQVLHVGAGADREQALAVEDGGDLQGWAWEAIRREAGGGVPVNKLWLKFRKKSSNKTAPTDHAVNTRPAPSPPLPTSPPTHTPAPAVSPAGSAPPPRSACGHRPGPAHLR